MVIQLNWSSIFFENTVIIIQKYIFIYKEIPVESYPDENFSTFNMYSRKKKIVLSSQQRMRKKDIKRVQIKFIFTLVHSTEYVKIQCEI